MTLPQKTPPDNGNNIIEFLIQGDLEKLTPDQRADYLIALCKSLGLNPLTRPFEFMRLGGKLVPYAKRDAADQLRKLHGISVQVISQDVADGMLSVHVKARDKTGREDEDVGVVNFPKDVKGELRANLIMKCVTKAKRRVTLSISGLGFLDETEVADIPRDNPHTIKPEEMIDVVPQDHPDRIPESDADLKPLRVVDQRKIYEELIKELQAIYSEDELQEWKQSVPARMAGLSAKWKEYMQSAFAGHIAWVRSCPSWLPELVKAYRSCTSAEEVFEAERSIFYPVQETANTTDCLRASKAREETLARIEKETPPHER